MKFPHSFSFYFRRYSAKFDQRIWSIVEKKLLDEGCSVQEVCSRKQVEQKLLDEGFASHEVMSGRFPHDCDSIIMVYMKPKTNKK